MRGSGLRGGACLSQPMGMVTDGGCDSLALRTSIDLAGVVMVDRPTSGRAPRGRSGIHAVDPQASRRLRALREVEAAIGRTVSCNPLILLMESINSY